MSENENNQVPNVVIGYDNMLYIGNFVPQDGTDYLVPVDPERDVDGQPKVFRELELPLGYARRLSALLVARLAEHDGRAGGSYDMNAPVGLPYEPSPFELGGYR